MRSSTASLCIVIGSEAPYKPMPKTESIFQIAKGARRSNSLIWIFDKFERESNYIQAKMFGCEAAYIDGMLCLVVADRDEPWNGLLVCTSQEHHAALTEEMPALRPHAVLGKWLYVSQDDQAFEDIAEELTTLVLARDPRVGVEPKSRKRR